MVEGVRRHLGIFGGGVKLTYSGRQGSIRAESVGGEDDPVIGWVHGAFVGGHVGGPGGEIPLEAELV